MTTPKLFVSRDGKHRFIELPLDSHLRAEVHHEDSEAIKRLAKKAGMSVSAYVRGLIINHLSEQGELRGLTVRGNQKAAGDGGSVEVQSSYCKISVKDVS